MVGGVCVCVCVCVSVCVSQYVNSINLLSTLHNIYLNIFTRSYHIVSMFHFSFRLNHRPSVMKWIDSGSGRTRPRVCVCVCMGDYYYGSNVCVDDKLSYRAGLTYHLI